MKNRNTNQLLINAKTSLLVMTMILGIFAVTAFADNINLDMQGTTASIPKGNTIQRSLYNIPNGIPGTLRLKLKWHAVNILPTFNALRVQLKHGNTTVKTQNCYSIHSNKTPKCNTVININQIEAGKPGAWKLVITNNSGFEVVGFNIEKGSDINPLVPNFRSTYKASCSF